MNIRGRIEKTKIVFLLLLIPALSFAEAYKPPLISDVTTIEDRSENMKLSDRAIEYSISYQSTYSTIYNALYESHSPDHLIYIIKDSWNLLKRFMDENNITYKDCRYDYNINIFVLDRSIMYDTQRFGRYYRTKGRPEVELWAYYDSTVEVKNNSIILLTDVDSSFNDALFAHELAHYWWDRTCLKEQWQGSSEQFARQYEKYYRAKR